MSEHADSSGPPEDSTDSRVGFDGALVDGSLVEATLEAVDRPALVCDPDGRVRAWNDAMTERVPVEDGDREAAFEDVLEVDGDPLATAVETGETTTVDGRIGNAAVDCELTCRAVDGDDGASVVVSFDVGEETGSDAASPTGEGKLRTVIESSADPIAMQDVDGRFQVVNEAMIAVVGRERSDLIGATTTDVFDDDLAARLEAQRRDVLETERGRVFEVTFPGPAGDRIVQLTLTPQYGSDGAVEGSVAIARDITELESQRDELETLTEIQELVQENVRALTAATTREEIQRTVCDRLAGSQFYEFAWIGHRSSSGQMVEPSCAAGVGEEYLDEVTITADASEHGRGPAGEAYRTGHVQVVHDVTEAAAFEPWREAALDHGFRSVAAVPLTHGSTNHGLLAVYASSPKAFSRRELAGFETLGEVVGFALSAAQYRRLLEADSVLELEFEVRSDESPFLAGSVEHDCRFVIDHAVRTGEQRVVNYLTVEGADPAVGESVARELDNLERIRRLDGADGPHFELTLSDSVFQYVADAGARGKSGTIEDGVGLLVVEAPGDVDLRAVSEAVEDRFDAVELVAKRENRHTDTPWWHAHGDIGAKLTDRQRSVLRAAYFSGYYEWPRETDSETLAESLDVASTTFLQHLRKGHGRVLEALFDS